MSTTTQNETEFSNNNIKVKVDRKEGCRVNLDIIVHPVASKAAYAKAIKEVSKEVSIPGFRRGKAPESTILQKFSSQVKSEWENVLFNTAVSEAFGLVNIYPAMDNNNRPQMLKTHSMKASKDEDSYLKVEFETVPTIPDIDINQLTINAPEAAKVDEKKKEDRLHELLLSKAEWEKLENRKIVEGDFVDVSFSNPDEEEKSEEDGEMTRYWVRQDKVPEGYYKELVGRKINDSFVFKDGENEPIRSTIKAILKANLPEQNDELAKQFGANDLETLKSRIAQSLETEAKNAQHDAIGNDLINQLTEKFPVDLPESMIKKHRATIAKRTISNLKKMMPDSSNEDRQHAISQLDNMINERSRHVTHLRYLIHSLARANHVSITDQEFQNEIEQVYYRSQSGMGPYIDFSDDVDEIRSEVYNQLMTQKILSLLIEKIGNKS